MPRTTTELEAEVARLRAFIVAYSDLSTVQGTWMERRADMVLEWGYEPLACDKLMAAADEEAWARLSLDEKRQALEAERATAAEIVSRMW